MDFLKNLAALIKVKTIVTLTVMAVFSYLAVRGGISADNVMIVVSTVIAFYFGTQQSKN
jgi:allophanate hydrolase subunit 2